MKNHTSNSNIDHYRYDNSSVYVRTVRTLLLWPEDSVEERSSSLTVMAPLFLSPAECTLSVRSEPELLLDREGVLSNTVEGERTGKGAGTGVGAGNVVGNVGGKGVGRGVGPSVEAETGARACADWEGGYGYRDGDDAGTLDCAFGERMVLGPDRFGSPEVA